MRRPMIELRIDGKPTGKGRPRFARGRTFTDPATEAAQHRVERAWETAGKPRVPDGPIAFELQILVARPKTHRKRDGSLSAEGHRHPWPRRKPDLDNALKLGMDALNGRAYRDDVDIVHAWALRLWAPLEQTEHTLIRVRAMPVPAAAPREAA